MKYLPSIVLILIISKVFCSPYEEIEKNYQYVFDQHQERWRKFVIHGEASPEFYYFSGYLDACLMALQSFDEEIPNITNNR